MALSPDTLSEIAASPRSQILRALQRLEGHKRNPQFSDAYADNADAVELETALRARLEEIDEQAKADAVADVLNEALGIVDEPNE
jgi:hypothetical protein